MLYCPGTMHPRQSHRNLYLLPGLDKRLHTRQNTEQNRLAEKVARDIDTVIKMGGFAVKEWVISSREDEYKQDTAIAEILLHDDHKVLGMVWERSADVLRYRVELRQLNLNSSDSVDIHQKLTKRTVLSQINSIFDPLGLNPGHSTKYHEKCLGTRIRLG